MLLDLSITADYPGKPNALRDFSLSVGEGEIVGLVGESGSGKSTVALSILRLLDHKSGRVRGAIGWNGHDLTELSEREMRRIRGREIALVLQSATASLNPALRIGTQFAEAWRAHATGPRGDWELHAKEIFARVSLPTDDRFFRRYPRELSVGQAQRVLIAMAVLHRPKLLIADEPTSALDAVTQAEVLALLRQLNRDLRMAILFISHDLASVTSLCGRVAIMKAGRIVESGVTAEIFRAPAHPYTRALLAAIPRFPHSEDAASSLTALSSNLGFSNAPEPFTEPVYSVSSTSRSTDIE